MKNNENKKIIVDPMSFLYLKWIFTISLTIGLISSFIQFLYYSIGKFELLNNANKNKITIITTIISIIGISIYLFLRIWIHKKSTYKFNSREQKYYIIFITCSIICGIIFFLNSVLFINKPTNWVFYFILLTISLISMIFASIFETLIRIRETKHIAVINNNINEDNLKENDDIVKNSNDINHSADINYQEEIIIKKKKSK